MDKNKDLNPAYSHIVALDGLRGVAIALVLIVHFYYRGPQMASPPVSKEFFIFGWTGVELFFVLSGFLITSILLKAKGVGGSLGGFYLNRAARILPLYIAFLVVLLAASFIALPSPLSDSLLNFRDYFFTYFFYIANFSYIAGWDVSHANILLGPTWSLAVEQHFYLIWPLIVLFLSLRTTRFLIVSLYLIMVLSRAVMAENINPDVVYHTTFLHFDGLAIGSIAAIFLPSICERPNLAKYVTMASAITIAALFVSQGTFHYKNPQIFSLGIPLVNLFYCSAMIYVMSSNVLTKIFSIKPLTVLGKYSYCIYLLHWPMLMVFSQIKISTGLIGWSAMYVAFTMALLMMARVSWILLESPSSKYIRSLKRNKE